MKNARFEVSTAILLGLALLPLLFPTRGLAVNGGEDVDPKKRTPHETTGATVWTDGPHLVEPCSAVLLCQNVILTVNHCINFAPSGESYFTLVNDINALPGKGSRYEKVVAEYKRKDQKTTARLDRESVKYGETYRTPFGILTGLTMIKFKGDDALADLPYLSLAKADFKLEQDLDRKVWDRDDAANFLRPGKDASLGIIAGYGDSGPKRAGAGKLKRGEMRFMSWIEPTTFQPQGTTRPDAGDRENFLIQFASKNAGNAHGCPGDSGGPLLVDKNRLSGNLDFITDQTCAGKDLESGGGNFNTYVSLLYTKNRSFVSDYMAANCGDKRTIDVKTGDNFVKGTKEESKGEESCSLVSRNTGFTLSEEQYLQFLASWTVSMESGLPGVGNVTAIDDPLAPVRKALEPQLVCSSPTPEETPSVSPIPMPTEETAPEVLPIPTQVSTLSTSDRVTATPVSNPAPVLTLSNPIGEPKTRVESVD